MTIELVPIEDIDIGQQGTEKEMKDSEEGIKKKFEFVVNYFQKVNPNPTTELQHKNGYELLVAVILSAQTQDKRVNMVTPALFEKYPSPEDLAKADPNDVYRYISSVNYAGNKSEYLVRSANRLVSIYGSKIPEDINELLTLPGVGRKTANVIAATLYNKPVIAVDTHVSRVADRIGLTTGAKTPLDAEEQLMMYTPKEAIPKLSHWLILHGRYICTAKNPQCLKCGVNEVCRYYQKLKMPKVIKLG